MRLPWIGFLRILAMDTAWGLLNGEPKIVFDARQAAAWTAETLPQMGYRLDFSLASLREVDRFFEELIAGRIMFDHPPASTPGHFVFALGAYTGEVIRREGNGVWKGLWRDPLGMRLAVHLPKGKRFWPIQRALKRYRNGLEDGIYAYGLGILDRLDEATFDDIWPGRRGEGGGGQGQE